MAGFLDGLRGMFGGKKDTKVYTSANTVDPIQDIQDSLQTEQIKAPLLNKSEQQTASAVDDKSTNDASYTPPSPILGTEDQPDLFAGLTVHPQDQPNTTSPVSSVEKSSLSTEAERVNAIEEVEDKNRGTYAPPEFISSSNARVGQPSAVSDIARETKSNGWEVDSDIDDLLSAHDSPLASSPVAVPDITTEVEKDTYLHGQDDEFGQGPVGSYMAGEEDTAAQAQEDTKGPSKPLETSSEIASNPDSLATNADSKKDEVEVVSPEDEQKTIDAVAPVQGEAEVVDKEKDEDKVVQDGVASDEEVETSSVAANNGTGSSVDTVSPAVDAPTVAVPPAVDAEEAKAAPVAASEKFKIDIGGHTFEYDEYPLVKDPKGGASSAISDGNTAESEELLTKALHAAKIGEPAAARDFLDQYFAKVNSNKTELPKDPVVKAKDADGKDIEVVTYQGQLKDEKGNLLTNPDGTPQKGVVAKETRDKDDKVWYEVTPGQGPRTIKVPRLDDKGKPDPSGAYDVLQFDKNGEFVGATIADKPGKSQVNAKELEAARAKVNGQDIAKSASISADVPEVVTPVLEIGENKGKEKQVTVAAANTPPSVSPTPVAVDEKPLNLSGVVDEMKDSVKLAAQAAAVSEELTTAQSGPKTTPVLRDQYTDAQRQKASQDIAAALGEMEGTAALNTGPAVTKLGAKKLASSSVEFEPFPDDNKGPTVAASAATVAATAPTLPIAKSPSLAGDIDLEAGEGKHISAAVAPTLPVASDLREKTAAASDDLEAGGHTATAADVTSVPTPKQPVTRMAEEPIVTPSQRRPGSTIAVHSDSSMAPTEKIAAAMTEKTKPLTITSQSSMPSGLSPVATSPGQDQSKGKDKQV